jgi:organic hydroperoxide reductase OsmC/OhrA
MRRQPRISQSRASALTSMKDSEKACPVSKVLDAKITVDAKLLPLAKAPEQAHG